LEGLHHGAGPLSGRVSRRKWRKLLRQFATIYAGFPHAAFAPERDAITTQAQPLHDTSCKDTLSFETNPRPIVVWSKKGTVRIKKEGNLAIALFLTQRFSADTGC
jgi:hypothetical protein